MKSAAPSSPVAAKSAGVKQRGRPRGKPFAAGVSGNPQGKRPGEESKAAKLRATIADAMPGLLEVVVRNALAGDMQAARCLIDRCLAPLKPREAPVSLPMQTGATVSEQAAAVIQAAADGIVPITQAAQLVAAIGHMQNIVAVDDVVRRIEALERAANETH